MTIDELQQYAISLGVGIGCEHADQDLINAIFAGLVTSKIQVSTFTGF